MYTQVSEGEKFCARTYTHTIGLFKYVYRNDTTTEISLLFICINIRNNERLTKYKVYPFINNERHKVNKYF